MKSLIIEAVLNGINKAHNIQWERGGGKAFYPVESVYQCYIADAINKAGFKYINYEYQIAKLIKELQIRPKSSITTSTGRVDLLVRSNSNEEPIAIVEIKSEFAQESALKKDIFRICDLLQYRSKDISKELFGVFAVGLLRHREADIRKHIEDSYEALENNIVKIETSNKGCSYSCHKKDFEHKANVIWGACAYVIRA